MNSEIKILGEDSKSYDAEIDGKRVKLFKIDKDEIKNRRIQSLQYAAEKIDEPCFIGLFKLVEYCKNNIPTVDKYEQLAIDISEILDLVYDQVGHKYTNIFHYYFKDISPSIYGKAQTFMKNINMLYDDLCYIGRILKKTGRLKEFKTNHEKN